MSYDASSDLYRQQYNPNQKYQRREFHLPDRYASWDKQLSSQNTTPASTVLNSPDLIDVHQQQQYQQQHQINVGRSPVNSHNDGDDVDDDHENFGIINLTGSNSSLPHSIEQQTLTNALNKSLYLDNNHKIYDNIGDNWKSDQNTCATASASNNKMTKLIDYDGSPRRFGDYYHDYETNDTIKADQNIRREMTSNSKIELSTDELCQESSYEHPRTNCAYIGQRLANIAIDEYPFPYDSTLSEATRNNKINEIELYLDSNSHSSSNGELADMELESHRKKTISILPQQPAPLSSSPLPTTSSLSIRHLTLSPESTDFDSNCDDLDSSLHELALTSITGGGGGAGSGGCCTDYARLYTGMPILEDGLSSGHASDTDNNNCSHINSTQSNAQLIIGNIMDDQSLETMANNKLVIDRGDFSKLTTTDLSESMIRVCNKSPSDCTVEPLQSIEATIRDIRTTLQRTQTFVCGAGGGGSSGNNDQSACDYIDVNHSSSPIWIPRHLSESHESINSDNGVTKPLSPDQEDEADTDLETDRLLGQQRLDDQQCGYNEEKISWRDCGKIKKSLTLSHLPQTFTSAAIRQGIGTPISPSQSQLPAALHSEMNSIKTAPSSPLSPIMSQKIDDNQTNITTSLSPPPSPQQLSPPIIKSTNTDCSPIKIGQTKSTENTGENAETTTKNKEDCLQPAVLIEGVLFRAKYLGSTQLVCEGQPTKSTRMLQAEEAVSRIKAPEGESQPSTEVDLFISTEKIMVLNTDLKEIMMDHSLRTISYIADIGDLVVLMARRRFVSNQSQTQDSNTVATTPNSTTITATTGSAIINSIDDMPATKPNRTPKMICHVFESDEAQFIAQSIGQAFQVAYMEFLKANGIEDHSFVKEMDYQEVLNSQEIFGDELEIFAKKELQKEVVVPKGKGEILGLVIVESGWGSMLPTVVIANLMSTAAAARCGQLNIGDQIIAINGLSLVGLPLSTCQNYIRNTKNQSAVKFTVVPCPPVVEVKIKRPNTKYQLGFSVQNGVICSLLRGGIAERGGVRVGHRIIEINNQSVVAVPHEKIVSLLATSVGEILMKTMPTSMFRLLTGQENPIYI